MTIEEIFSKIANHMCMGLLFHNQLATIYGFLNLQGYQKQQQHQYFEQAENYFKLNNFYLSTYGKMIILNKQLQCPQLIPDNWYKYANIEVDTSSKRSAIRDLFKEWIKWETDTIKLLQQCYFQIIALKDARALTYISEMIKEVNNELAFARKQQIDLQSIGYDIVFIVDNQDLIQKRVVEYGQTSTT